jgi:hypothetical protein
MRSANQLSSSVTTARAKTISSVGKRSPAALTSMLMTLKKKAPASMSLMPGERSGPRSRVVSLRRG